MVSLIAALSRNRVIGQKGGLPWRLPADSRHFRTTTMGKPVVMGRLTYESMDHPLDGRHNVVVTRNRDYSAAGCSVVHSLDEALELLAGEDEIMIGGGEALYAEALPLAERMYLTLVDADVEGDTHFPEFDGAEWRELEREEHPADERHAYAFSIVTLERKDRA
jgi:dihydrofolate reductase